MAKDLFEVPIADDRFFRSASAVGRRNLCPAKRRRIQCFLTPIDERLRAPADGSPFAFGRACTRLRSGRRSALPAHLPPCQPARTMCTVPL